MSLKPYAEYKDSGVEWLGQVPYEWEVSRLKNSVQEAKNGIWGNDPDGSELDLRCVRVADFDRSRQSIHDRNSTLRRVSLDDRKGRILEKGDLLLEKSGGGEKSPVGFVVLYDRDEPAVCSNFVARLVIHPGMDSRFWTYVHSMFYSLRLTQRSIKQATGIQNLDQTSYFNELVALPPYTVQRDIADYLDQETAEIDAFLADQEDLITLLAERRTATITRAVTKGIDPSAPMKNSDIEWLNEVPIHWTVTSLKHYINVLPGYAFKSEHFTQEETDVRLLRGVNINPGSVKWGDVVRFDYSQRPDLKDYELQSGDLVLGLDRPIVSDGIRVASISDEDLPSLVLQRVARIRTKPRANKLFVRYLLESEVFANYLAPLFTGVSVPHMSPGQLGSFTVAMAPLTEQQKIVDYLERETSEIDAAIDDAREAIALSKERRAAVISATVTGKIDVRGLVTPAANNVEGVSVGIA